MLGGHLVGSLGVASFTLALNLLPEHVRTRALARSLWSSHKRKGATED